MTSKAISLSDAVKTLKKHYGAPAGLPTKDPFELVLWENVAYLAKPARRREAFDELRRTVGTEPMAILSAKPEALERITSRGILKGVFVAKLRECAEIALDKFDGNLDTAVRAPIEAAKRALRSFPGIGEPGAEKILLFAGRHPLLAPDSNALRVLVRVGWVRDENSYARTYAASREIAKTLTAKVSVVQEAHLLLQQHGQTLCKHSAPRCGECPITTGCAYFAAHMRTSRATRPAARTSRRRP